MSIDLKTLDELERLSNEATPGPWEGNGRGAYVAMMHITDNRIKKYVSAPQAEMCISDSDIDFIVQSRNALPELISAIRKMREALAFYSNENHWHDDMSCGVPVKVTGGPSDPVEWDCEYDMGDTARTCLKELGLE